jgi:diaminohydroxyphosphoribosylaminopyrimidine deaminase/5-amino-6-(5-phosphoribosylamino)uracil reductase
MISSKTLNIDNPKLTCRLKGYEKFSPKRIILDKNLVIKRNSFIVKSIKKQNTIIFYNTSNSQKIKFFKSKGAILVKSQLKQDGLFNLEKILKKLFNLGVRHLLIEGGNKITNNLVKSKLIDVFYLFQSPKSLSKANINQSFTSFKILNKNYKKRYRLSSKLAKDIITIYKR